MSCWTCMWSCLPSLLYYIIHLDSYKKKKNCNYSRLLYKENMQSKHAEKCIAQPPVITFAVCWLNWSGLINERWLSTSIRHTICNVYAPIEIQSACWMAGWLGYLIPLTTASHLRKLTAATEKTIEHFSMPTWLEATSSTQNVHLRFMGRSLIASDPI